MMQLCSSLLWIVILWWTGTCIGAAVDAPNAGSPKPPIRNDEATGLSKVKVALPASHVTDTEKKVELKKEEVELEQEVVAAAGISELVTETKVGDSNPRQKRSLTPADTFTQGHRRYRRLPWKSRAWREEQDADYESSPKSSFPESGSSSSSLIYQIVSSDIDNKEENSFARSDKKDSFLSEDSNFQVDAFKSAPDRAEDEMYVQPGEKSADEVSQPLKRVDRSLTSDLFAAAGSNLAKNFMKRRRGGRMYDVPQIGEFDNFFFRQN